MDLPALGYLKPMLFSLAWISYWKHLLLNSVHSSTGTFGVVILDNKCSSAIVLAAVVATPSNLYKHLNLDEMCLFQNTSVSIGSLAWMSCMVFCSFLFNYERKHMYIAKAGMNIFKQVWKVLSFSRKHKYPLNRSAFTYCEDNVPSRLDLGKEQYGGPFTTEQVEDVRTFFQLLLLLMSLFGYHIATDGFAPAHHMERYSCPSVIIWGLLALNPGFLSSMVVLISIPLFEFMPNIHKFAPNMLKRMGIGLIILLIQDCFYIALAALPILDNGQQSFSNYSVDQAFGQALVNTPFVLN